MDMKRLFITASILGVLVFWVGTAVAQEGGNFSAYLVGIYDLRAGYTLFQIVNPTANPLELWIAFFDENEKPLKCAKEKLSHNDLFELDVRRLKLPAKFGVAKIISHKETHPTPGIVGFQRHIFEKGGPTESNLAAVPMKVLDEEMKIILEVCK